MGCACSCILQLTKTSCIPKPGPSAHPASPRLCATPLRFLDSRRRSRTGPQEAFQTEPRRIDRAFGTGINKDIVEEPPERTSQEARNHWNPEIIVTSRPDSVSVAHRVGHESRPKVPGEIYSIALYRSAGAPTTVDDRHTVSHPKEAPNPKMRKKSAKGKNGPAPVLPMAPRLDSSLRAKITNMSKVAVMNSEKN